MARPLGFGSIAALSLALAFLAGCGSGEAPTGRWEGFSESAHWLLAVRLQVDPGNTIHSTALSVSIDGASLPRRMELQSRIKSMLAEQWPHATIGKVDYQDHTITKAGGVAPLFVFEPKSGTMTFYFFANGKLTERIKLYPVRAFADAT